MDYKKEFTSYQDVFIKDVTGLIRIASIRDETSVSEGAPFGKGCRDALDYMLNLGKRDGFVVKDIDGYAGVIEYGEGSESVGVLAHLDIVPIGDGWHHDPLGAEIVQGYMFGRGTMDDKGPAMAGYYALKMLKDHNVKLNKKVMLIIGCDEESGMECMEYYKKHAEIPTLGFTPDADFPVIYGEKGGLHVHLSGTSSTILQEMKAGERINVVIGEASALVPTWDATYNTLFEFYLQTNALQGSVRKEQDAYRLTIKGTSAHGAMPYHGNNAALHILNFVGSAYEDAFAKQLYQLLHDWMGTGLHIAFEGASMGFLTMNTGVVTLNNQQVEILLDIRYPNDISVEDIKASIQKTIEGCSVNLNVAFHEKAKPLFVDPTSKLVTTLHDAYRFYSHDELTPNKTIGGGTYAKKFDNFVAFGPEFPNTKPPKDLLVGGVHQGDEAVCLEDLFTSVAIYAASIEKLAE